MPIYSLYFFFNCSKSFIFCSFSACLVAYFISTIYFYYKTHCTCKKIINKENRIKPILISKIPEAEEIHIIPVKDSCIDYIIINPQHIESLN